MDSEVKHLASPDTLDENSEYERKFDTYRPKFVGIPEGEFPNSWGHVIFIYALLGILYIISGAVFAFFLWLLFLDTNNVSWIYAGSGFIYAVVMIILIFYGQNVRGGLEKKYMQEALEHHAKVVEQTRM